jgi:hypothetical protein
VEGHDARSDVPPGAPRRRRAQSTAVASVVLAVVLFALWPGRVEPARPAAPPGGPSSARTGSEPSADPGREARRLRGTGHRRPGRQGPGRPPPVATSRYLKTTDRAWLGRLGCVEGRAVRHHPGLRDLLVVLAFGRPTRRDHGFGASLFGEGPAPLFRIREAAQSYARGFVRCSPGSPTHLRLAVGTSNYGPRVGYRHGRAWAVMVNRANEWLARRGLAGRVTVTGAIDIELAWNGPRVTRAWVRGYDSVARWPFYNFGAMESCPPVGDCWGAWTLDDVWYVSWGARTAWPLPQVYTPNGSMAAQWFTLARYSYRRHRTQMRIPGVMTQHAACRQSHESCRGTDNRPHEAWRQLQRLLNTDRRTAQRVRWVTDIRWRGAGTALLPRPTCRPHPGYASGRPCTSACAGGCRTGRSSRPSGPAPPRSRTSGAGPGRRPCAGGAGRPSKPCSPGPPPPPGPGLPPAPEGPPLASTLAPRRLSRRAPRTATR